MVSLIIIIVVKCEGVAAARINAVCVLVVQLLGERN